MARGHGPVEGDAEERCNARSVNYSLAITAYGKGGLWEEAMDLLREMQTEGGNPRRCGLQLADHSVSKQRAVGGRSSCVCCQSYRGVIIPDAASYNSAITASENSGQCDEDIGPSTEMQREGAAADVVSYTSATAACRNSRRWEQSVALLGQLDREDVERRPNVP